MEITAAQVKELREKTGLGMMICKKALIESNGNMELAIESLRKQGQQTAAKRAGKVAKEGMVAIVSDRSCSIIYEVNTETDFVARNEDFVSFVKDLGSVLLERKPSDISAAKNCTAPEMGGMSIENRITELVGKIGEIITFRRYRKMECDPARERIFSYVHGHGKIGVLVKCSATAGIESEELALLGKDLAMQVAALNPVAVDRNRIAPEILAKEKEIYFTQAKNSGKPEKVWEKIVEGKLAKFFQDSTLLEQAFVKKQDINVSDRVRETEKVLGGKITVEEFVRFELGAEE